MAVGTNPFAASATFPQRMNCLENAEDRQAPEKLRRNVGHFRPQRPDRYARRAGWPWRLPARAPTDPYVLTLEHTVPQPTDSPPAKDPEAIRSSYGDM